MKRIIYMYVRFLALGNTNKNYIRSSQSRRVIACVYARATHCPYYVAFKAPVSYSYPHLLDSFESDICASFESQPAPLPITSSTYAVGSNHCRVLRHLHLSPYAFPTILRKGDSGYSTLCRKPGASNGESGNPVTTRVEV